MSRSLDSSVSRDSSSSSHPFHSLSGPLQLDPGSQNALGMQSIPPFENTKTFSNVLDGGGMVIQPELHARIDKGFFKADTDWTCYRRNYFSVACCYCLKPDVDPSARPLYLQRPHSNNRERIHSFSILIVAKIDNDDGKPIELVQHTPKRDKGPMGPPDLTEVSPHPSGNIAMFTAASPYSPNAQLSSDQDHSYTAGPQQPPNVANFDRIQFKKATANNGKRRAAQQYFHIIVELYAKVNRGKSADTHDIKVAHRVSAPMVVRGRSPGHYSDERRGSSTSMGPTGGSSGDHGPGYRDQGSAGPSGGSHSSMSGGVSYSSSGHAGGSGYQAHHNSMAHSPTASHSNPVSESSSNGSLRRSIAGRHSDPAPTMEEAAQIEEYEGYQYYPSTLYEASPHVEPIRPGLADFRYRTQKLESDTAPTSASFGHFVVSPQIRISARTPIKTEPFQKHTGGNHVDRVSGYRTQPHSTSPGSVPSMLRNCGRFQGVDSSRGYYPATPAL
ncbi:hypothetical protein MMC13_007240 [Lambiella insularis]|nr:hypothetical protein [Lambiella insularis]